MKKKRISRMQCLSPFEKEVLYTCDCLCNAGELSWHNFTALAFPGKTHETNTAIESLAIKGYIRAFDGTIYGIHDRSRNTIPTNHVLMQEILGRLLEMTSNSLYEHLSLAKDFYIAGYSYVKFVVRNTPNIDYNIFADLLCRLVEHINIWCPRYNHAERTEELPIMQALNLSLTKFPANTPVVSRVNAVISLFYSNAWRYSVANEHLKIAEDIDMNTYGNIQYHTCIAHAVYYWNYGQYAVALKYYFTAVNMADNEKDKTNPSIMIALILALLGEGESCQNWLRLHAHCYNNIPEIHETQIIYCMILSLLEDNMDSAIEHLNMAERILIQINHEGTPMGGLLHYVRSQVWATYGFKKRSLNEYKQYVLNNMTNYKSGGGGWDILFSGRIEYHLDYGSVTTGKILCFKELDSIDIYSSDLSFSVRSEVSKCYTRLFKELKLYPLAITYNNIFEVHRKLYKPSASTLECIAPLFDNGIPSFISLDTAWETALEQIHLEIFMLEERPSAQRQSKTIDEIQKSIDELKSEYPELRPYLKIAEGRLDTHKDLMTAVRTWNNVIETASEDSLFIIARESANWCAFYGAIFEASQMYRRAVMSKTFQEMPSFSKFDYLLEYVSLIEKTCYRCDAQTYWDYLEVIANEEQLPWLYFNRALVEYDHEQYEACHLFLSSFFSMYNQTEQFDELLSSAYCYYCSILIHFGKYDDGLQAIKKSMALWIDHHSFETFPLYANKAHCEIAINDFSAARQTMKVAEKLVGGKAEYKQMFDDLYNFYLEQRNLYYKNL